MPFTLNEENQVIISNGSNPVRITPTPKLGTGYPTHGHYQKLEQEIAYISKSNFINLLMINQYFQRAVQILKSYCSKLLNKDYEQVLGL